MIAGWSTRFTGFLAFCSVYYYPHDRKGGGLVVLIPDVCEETLFWCLFEIVFPHAPHWSRSLPHWAHRHPPFPRDPPGPLMKEQCVLASLVADTFIVTVCTTPILLFSHVTRVSRLHRAPIYLVRPSRFALRVAGSGAFFCKVPCECLYCFSQCVIIIPDISKSSIPH